MFTTLNFDNVQITAPTETDARSAHDEMLLQARGGYQTALAQGWHRWSGADLAGKAAQYAARYAESRRNLLARFETALPEFQFSIEKDPTGESRKNVLVVRHVDVI